MNITDNLRIVERGGDPFTLMEFRAMAESRAFSVFLQRIDKMIAADVHSIESSEDLDALRKLQGSLKALRTVRTLPSIIENEFAPLKRKP